MISEKTQIRLLCLFVMVGSALRLFQLGFQCYWTEEQYTLTISKLPFLEILAQSILGDCNPPIYYLSAHAAMILSQFGDIAIRYPSAISGILLIPAMYLLGYAYKNEMTGLYSSGFTAILFPLVYYSQFGRAYSMSMLFFVLALTVYIRIKNRDQSYGTKAMFGILAGLNIWIHLFSIIPIGLLMIDLVMTNGWKMKWSVIITGIMTVPLVWMGVTFIQSRLTAAPATGVNEGFGMTVPQILFLIPYEFFSTVFPYFGVLSIIGIRDIWRDKDGIGLRLIIIVALTIGIGIFCSLMTPFFPRYFLTVSLILVLISADACATLSEGVKTDTQKIWVMVGLMTLLLAMQYGSYLAHYTVQKYAC